MDSDLVLISRVVLLDDQRAFARLMRKYQRPVRRYFLVETNGNEALATDLAQETFIHAWQNIGSFHGLSGFGTWLYRIAHNTWLNWLARHHDLLSLDDPVVRTEVEVAPNLDSRQGSDTLETDQLRVAVARLPEAERTCIALFYLQELSLREIHRVTGWPVGTIKSHLSRGRNHLKNLFDYD